MVMAVVLVLRAVVDDMGGGVVGFSERTKQRGNEKPKYILCQSFEMVSFDLVALRCCAVAMARAVRRIFVSR